MDNKGLHFTFFNDKRESENHTLLFYERNPAERGLDFDDYPEDKPDFVGYAVELRCLNPVVDTKKTPLMPLEDLAEAVTALMQVGLHHNKEPRKELENIFQADEGVTKEWIPETQGRVTKECSRDVRINTRLGAGGVITPCMIQDPEGEKTMVKSFKTLVGAVAVVHR